MYFHTTTTTTTTTYIAKNDSIFKFFFVSESSCVSKAFAFLIFISHVSHTCKSLSLSSSMLPLSSSPPTFHHYAIHAHQHQILTGNSQRRSSYSFKAYTSRALSNQAAVWKTSFYYNVIMCNVVCLWVCNDVF